MMPRKQPANGLQEAHVPTKINTAAPEHLVVGETKFGKEIEVYRMKHGRTFKVRFIGGGEMPEELSGEYVRFADAEFAVEVYLIRNASTLPQE
jgi:hypothetical protein